jgi:DNA-binding transcriptional MerR regulator
MMQIGDLATKAGITTRTIRYYEELGIIEPEERSEGGFRLYSEIQLRRLHIIQSLKSLGFELERIRELFNLQHCAETGGDLSRTMIELLADQQRKIDAKICHYLEMKEWNAQAIEVLKGCMSCSIKVFERDCHKCEVYKQHAEVPDVIECAIYAG